MTLRMNWRTANPEAQTTMLELERAVRRSGIDHKLYELIKLRASQINGCSYCIETHARELLNAGEQPERIWLLSVWRESPIYSEKEKAVLELTEAVTRISEAGVPEHVYEKIRSHVDDRTLVALIMAINTINCWNRIAISTGMYPGCFD